MLADAIHLPSVAPRSTLAGGARRANVRSRRSDSRPSHFARSGTSGRGKRLAGPAGGKGEAKRQRCRRCSRGERAPLTRRKSRLRVYVARRRTVMPFTDFFALLFKDGLAFRGAISCTSSLSLSLSSSHALFNAPRARTAVRERIRRNC